MKIKEYKIVSGIGLTEINKIVNEHIKDNWIPIGGVATLTWTEQEGEFIKRTTQYSQTLVKYEE